MGTSGHSNPVPAMPAKPALEPVFIKARDRWRVDVPASKSSNGKRIRAHFKTRQAARDYIDRIDGPSPAAAIDTSPLPPDSQAWKASGSITSTQPIIPECCVPQYSVQKRW